MRHTHTTFRIDRSIGSRVKTRRGFAATACGTNTIIRCVVPVSSSVGCNPVMGTVIAREKTCYWATGTHIVSRTFERVPTSPWHTVATARLLLVKQDRFRPVPSYRNAARRRGLREADRKPRGVACRLARSLANLLLFGMSGIGVNQLRAEKFRFSSSRFFVS